MVIATAPRRTNNPSGRPTVAAVQARNATLREYNAQLRLEVRQLLGEVARLGVELIAIGSRIEIAFAADRPDVAVHYAARLDDLGRACIRRGGKAA